MAKKSIGAILSLKDSDFRTKMRRSIAGWDKFQSKAKQSKQALAAFEKTVDQTKSKLTGMTKAMAGAAAATIGITSAGGLFTKAINEASNLEGYRNILDIVMKDTQKAAETMRWAVEFANKTPFETGQIVEATAKLQAYGLTAQEILPAVGNMAGAMNKDLIQAVEAVADAQTGELERLKEFGITKQMIVDHANKIMRGKEIVNNKGQITDQKAFNKALFSLMEERFKGGMEKQAKSFKGIMSTITGVFSTSLAEIAGISADGTIRVGSLFDTIKQKAQVAADTLQKWQSDGTLEALGQKFTNTFNSVVDGIRDVVDAYRWMKQQSEVLIPILGGVASAITAFKIIKTVDMLVKAWRASTIAMTFAQGGLNAVLAANPIGLVVTAIGLLVAAGITLYRNWDTVKAKALDLWLSVENTFKTYINKVIGWLNKLIEGINKIPGVAIPKIKELDIAYRPQSVGDFRRIEGSYARGLSYVPHNGFLAELHQGERVLTKEEAKTYNNTRNNAKVEIHIHGANMTPEQIANVLVPKIKLALANM